MIPQATEEYKALAKGKSMQMGAEELLRLIKAKGSGLLRLAPSLGLTCFPNSTMLP